MVVSPGRQRCLEFKSAEKHLLKTKSCGCSLDISIRWLMISSWIFGWDDIISQVLLTKSKLFFKCVAMGLKTGIETSKFGL